MKEGDNKNFPSSGMNVTVNYIGLFPNSGKKFDSSYDRKEPFTFNLERKQVIKN